MMISLTSMNMSDLDSFNNCKIKCKYCKHYFDVAIINKNNLCEKCQEKTDTEFLASIRHLIGLLKNE
jgi:hypothetical protein